MRKRCSRCGKNRGVKFFTKDSRYRLGVQCWCRDCMKKYNQTPARRKKRQERWQQYVASPENQEYERKRGQKRYRRDPRHRKDLVFKNQYGISLKKFERTKRCLLCKREVRLVADHNHKTDTYRGALCHQCNLVIGWIEKFPNLLKKIQKYLRRG